MVYDGYVVVPDWGPMLKAHGLDPGSVRELKTHRLGYFGYLKGKGDIDMAVEIEVDVDVDGYFGCFKRASKSVSVLFNGIEAAMVLTWMILKQLTTLLLKANFVLRSSMVSVLGWLHLSHGQTSV